MTDLNKLNKLRSEFESDLADHLIERDANGFYINYEIQHYWDKYRLKAQIEELKAELEKAKAQAVPEGYMILPKTPSYEMWSGIARHLGRYMQMHDRYCPKTLKKYFDRFIGDIPEWLSKEVKDWDSDHAFATADLPAFIYMSMLEASESGAEG